MNLTNREADIIFAIMRELSGEFSHDEVRTRVGKQLLDLLDADYFASYVWNDAQGKFVSGVQLNMSDSNLAQYDEYYQFHDPITHKLQRRHKATPVSEIMAHEKLKDTEFFNDFLNRDGLYYGLNFFAWDRGENIGDVRIWRRQGKEDFCRRDAQLVDAIAPSFVNALLRTSNSSATRSSVRFCQIADNWDLTKREAEIADLAALGLMDEEISSKLFISKPTIRSHLSSIFRKLSVERRSQLGHLLATKNHQY